MDDSMATQARLLAHQEDDGPHCPCVLALGKKLAAAERENERLARHNKRLKRWANSTGHPPYCEFGMRVSAHDCRCGLDAALAAEPRARSTE